MNGLLQIMLWWHKNCFLSGNCSATYFQFGFAKFTFLLETWNLSSHHCITSTSFNFSMQLVMLWLFNSLVIIIMKSRIQSYSQEMAQARFITYYLVMLLQFKGLIIIITKKQNSNLLFSLPCKDINDGGPFKWGPI